MKSLGLTQDVHLKLFGWSRGEESGIPGVSYGNSFRTAELIYDTYAHPLTNTRSPSILFDRKYLSIFGNNSDLNTSFVNCKG